MLAAIILTLWVGGLGLLVRSELYRPHTERLAEAGLRVTPSATFFAVLREGTQVGFASTTVDTVDGGITVSDYLVADFPVAGAIRRSTSRTGVRLTRALRVTSFSVAGDYPLAPTEATGQVVGDTVLLLVVRGAAREVSDTQRVRLTGPILLPTLVPLVVALGERPGVGRSYTLSLFDPLARVQRAARVRVQAESVFVVQDSSVFDASSKRWRGAMSDTVRAWRLAMEGGSASDSGLAGWVDAQGRAVWTQQTLGLILERRPYEVAFENWKLTTRGGASAGR